MQKFNRYKDDKGRLFILLSKWAEVEFEPGTKTPIIKPTTVELLDVEKEALVPELTVEKLQNYIDKKLLIQIK